MDYPPVLATSSAKIPLSRGIDPARNFPRDQWPTFTHGGAPTASGLSRDLRECGLELAARGLLDAPVRRQLMACKLDHPEARALAEANGWRTSPMSTRPGNRI